MASIKSSLDLDTKEPVIPYSVMRYDLPRICRVNDRPRHKVNLAFKSGPSGIAERFKRKLGYTTNHHDIGLSYTWTDKLISIVLKFFPGKR